MFEIKSNIGGVLEKLNRFQYETVPAAVSDVFNPNLWIGEAVAVAQKTLNAIAAPGQSGFIPMFLQAIELSLIENGMRFRMDSQDLSVNLGRFVAKNALLNQLPLLSPMLDEERQRIDDLILEWVKDPKGKRLDAKDAKKTDEQIARDIQEILFHWDRSLERVEATKELVPHIQEYIHKRQASLGLTKKVISAWLKAVLFAWRELVAVRLPEMVCANLRRMSRAV